MDSSGSATPQEVEATFEIANELGLHAYAATKLVQTARRFASAIELVKDDQRVNGKNVLDVMTLAVSKGDSIRVRATGGDAGAAIEALRELVHDRFGEER